jgi:formylglycine-generating enzyme required for sulfatase activity
MNPHALKTVAAAIAAIATLAGPARSECTSDLDSSGAVDGADLGLLLAAWGPCAGCTADLDDNGSVDADDLGALLGAWGACPATVPGWATLIEARPDPAVVTDRALRAAIEATGLAWRVRDTATGIEMLLVPNGTFDMGCIVGSDSHPCDSWEQPVHQVTLTSPYYLGRFEVTQAQWQQRTGTNPAFFQSPSAQVPARDVGSRPVERVSWTGTQAFLGTDGLRLPTEAEWEFACRAGTRTPFHNGSTADATLTTIAWCGLNADGQTRAVGGRAPNALGFHDMLGNVWEWVGDRYSEYTADPQVDPTGADGTAPPIIRGGSWFSDSRYIRSSMRLADSPTTLFRDVGLRVARSP